MAVELNGGATPPLHPANHIADLINEDIVKLKPFHFILDEGGNWSFIAGQAGRTH
jgi:hypothetical protein